MIKLLTCSIKNRRGHCLKDYYEELKETLKMYQIEVDTIKEYYDKSVTTLVLSTFTEVLKMKFAYSINDIKYKENSLTYSNCPLSAKTCYQDIQNFEYQKASIANSIEKYNAKIIRLNDIVDHLIKLNQSNKGYENVHHKFYEDKGGKLVCTYFQLDEFDVYSPMMLIWLASKEPKFGEASNIAITYYSGKIKIDEFCVKDKRRWHGRYILKTLLELVPYFNAKIEEHNVRTYNYHLDIYKNYEEFVQSSYSFKKIKYIYGKIDPAGGMTYEELVEFYKSEGFYNNGRLYREV